jgi:hypothetical protein
MGLQPTPNSEVELSLGIVLAAGSAAPALALNF